MESKDRGKKDVLWMARKDHVIRRVINQNYIQNLENYYDFVTPCLFWNTMLIQCFVADVKLFPELADNQFMGLVTCMIKISEVGPQRLSILPFLTTWP